MPSFTAVVHKEEDMYVAECPEVGTISQGKTLEEAVHNLKEATELYLEEFPIREKERSFIKTFENNTGRKSWHCCSHAQRIKERRTEGNSKTGKN